MGINGLERLIVMTPTHCDKCNGDLEYLGIGRYQCVVCGNEMLDEYGKIRNYIDTYGPAPAWMIARETGISRKTIETLMQGNSVEFHKSAAFNHGNCNSKVHKFGNYMKNK